MHVIWLAYFTVELLVSNHCFTRTTPEQDRKPHRWKSDSDDMRGSKLLLQRLCNASTLSTAHPHPPAFPSKTLAQPLQWRPCTPQSSRESIALTRVYFSISSSSCHSRLQPSYSTILKSLRGFTTSSAHSREIKPVQSKNEEPAVQEEKQISKPNNEQAKNVDEEDELDHEQEERGFGRSEKASQATQINLSARLSSPKDHGSGAGLRETWRLIKIARPEVGVLGWAFLFLIVSSSISMTIPFSIGKFLDVATKSGEEGNNLLYGFDLQTLYLALGGLLFIGAGANYGRIIILRVVGERIVARLRSQLFRRTFVQNAEFFDANRVGDLISRLSSDTVIVGKSITQNLSDGLRSLVSGVAGITLMAFVSLKLTSVLAICFPPVAIGTALYGRAIRDLSRKIQKNLGTLTKIAEERLGNVRTSQAFAGEILEVARYNTQVKKIFTLGRREAFISATYFSSVGS